MKVLVPRWELESASFLSWRNMRVLTMLPEKERKRIVAEHEARQAELKRTNEMIMVEEGE